jgi:hypothetical protein
MISIETLETLQQTQSAREELVDIQSVRIDTTLPIVERLQDYLAQIKNPYHLLHGDAIVFVRNPAQFGYVEPVRLILWQVYIQLNKLKP